MKTIRLALTSIFLSAVTSLAGGASDSISTMIVGGGSSHDFQRWFNQADAETLR
ncbi:MAG TPA: ThuA domain-containing protein, partial [Verrucomicrobiales bacterium]|nr:ThuA domain-containing protein [Verrucomicrobiales bacterium]